MSCDTLDLLRIIPCDTLDFVRIRSTGTVFRVPNTPRRIQRQIVAHHQR